MEQLFNLRENVIYYYKKYDKIINLVLKIIFYSIAFGYILNLDMYNPSFAFLFEGSKGFLIFLVCVGFSLIFSTSLTYCLMILMVSLGLSNHLFLNIIVTALLLCVYLFYVRVAYNENILVLGTILLAIFKMPYLIGFIAGIFFPITSVLAIFAGSFIFNVLSVVKNEVVTLTSNNIEASAIIENVDGAISDISSVTNALLLNTDWLYLAIVICVGAIAINVISKFNIKYNFYIGIGSAFIIYLFGTIMIAIFTDSNINLVIAILGLLGSGVIACIMQFFSLILDYDSQEKVQFFDGENYYYVKIVPRYIVKKDKAKLNKVRNKSSELDVTKIRGMSENGNNQRKV